LKSTTSDIVHGFTLTEVVASEEDGGAGAGEQGSEVCGGSTSDGNEEGDTDVHRTVPLHGAWSDLLIILSKSVPTAHSCWLARQVQAVAAREVVALGLITWEISEECYNRKAEHVMVIVEPGAFFRKLIAERPSLVVSVYPGKKQDMKEKENEKMNS
jgi:hypothetical protein